MWADNPHLRAQNHYHGSGGADDTGVSHKRCLSGAQQHKTKLTGPYVGSPVLTAGLFFLVDLWGLVTEAALDMDIACTGLHENVLKLKVRAYPCRLQTRRRQLCYIMYV